MNRKFAEGITFKKLFWVFLIGSIFGAYYEEILYTTTHIIEYGTFAWSPRRGVLWGPLSPIYGIGAVLMTAVLVNKKDKLYITFFKAAALGGILEYLVSLFQEMFLGTVAWDYSEKILNLSGRTTIPYMLFWGFLGVLFIKMVYPAMEKVIESIPPIEGEKWTRVLLVIVILDIGISWSAIIRQSFRHYGIKQYTVIDRWYDEHFNDEYLNAHFPNTIVKK